MISVLYDTVIKDTKLYVFVKIHRTFWASHVAQTVKYLPAMQETWVWSSEEENGNPLQ